MRYDLAPEGRAYWQYIKRAYKPHGIPIPDHEEPRPNRRNRLAWMCWGWVYPDCREIGLSGGSILGWDKCVAVLRDFHGIDLTGDLHQKLRICMFEMLSIEAENQGVNDG